MTAFGLPGPVLLFTVFVVLYDFVVSKVFLVTESATVQLMTVSNAKSFPTKRSLTYSLSFSSVLVASGFSFLSPICHPSSDDYIY